MKHQAVTQKPAIDRTIRRARQAFAAGEIHETWDQLETLVGRDDLTDEQRGQIEFLQLGCAVYKVGDLDAANKLNAELPIKPDHLPVRYRLAIRQRQARTAKMLRSSPEAQDGGDRLIADFKCSAAIYCIWNGRMNAGIRLAHNRASAIMFPQIIPKALKYQPLSEDPADDVPFIILEQGVGDVIMQLAHIKLDPGHQTSTIFGLPRLRGLVKRWLPDATFVDATQVPKDMFGQVAHAGMDFPFRSWTRRKTFHIGDTPLDRPTRGVLDQPVLGICWRGGSGQNRREERHIPLQFFLDMLPRNGRYLALQFDLTDEEREILKQDPRVNVPFADLTEAPLRTLDMVRPLAGVISVDSANWHFAGASGVPFLAIMNKTTHWFWGPDGRAENAYPSATTIDKAALSPDVISQWQKQAIQSWRSRTKAKPAPKSSVDMFSRPVFLVSLPRSRSSMAAGMLASQGFWVGASVPPTSNNPKGFFENVKIRETYLKGILTDLGADPLGVTRLPDLDAQPPYPTLQYQLRRVLRKEEYDGGPWAFKDPKLTLLWPMFAKAFPNAQWVVLERDVDDNLDSICRTSFMKYHSRSPEFWKMFQLSYFWRLQRLKSDVPGVITINTDELLAGHVDPIERICADYDVPFDRDVCLRVAS